MCGTHSLSQKRNGMNGEIPWHALCVYARLRGSRACLYRGRLYRCRYSNHLLIRSISLRKFPCSSNSSYLHRRLCRYRFLCRCRRQLICSQAISARHLMPNYSLFRLFHPLNASFQTCGVCQLRLHLGRRQQVPRITFLLLHHLLLNIFHYPLRVLLTMG